MTFLLPSSRFFFFPVLDFLQLLSLLLGLFFHFTSDADEVVLVSRSVSVKVAVLGFLLRLLLEFLVVFLLLRLLKGLSL